MMKILAVASAAVVFGIFISLAQAHAIFVPYFTPGRVEFSNLQDEYRVNGSIAYALSLKGYGSNCIEFEVEVLRQNSSLSEDEERVAYYNQIQDCRTINISQGPYNYTRDFAYSGDVVLGKPGNYKVEVNVFDQITKQNYAETRSFTVIEEFT